MRLPAYGKPLLVVMLLLLSAAVLTVAYERARPRLSLYGRIGRLEESIDAGGIGEKRSDIASMREYLLDHPDRMSTRLRLRLALMVAQERDGDPLFVADEVEQAVKSVLASVGGQRLPARKDFRAAGFTFNAYYPADSDTTLPSPLPFLTADVDGDGRQDIVFATPGGGQQSLCLLLHNTKEGWKTHRLALNMPIAGLRVFPLTRHGPQAVALSSLLINPNTLTLYLDVFAWQNGRMGSILSTQTASSWKWDHKDVDGDGIEEIRLYRSASGEDRYSKPAQLFATYRWTGGQFVLSGKPPADPGAISWQTTGSQPATPGEETAGSSLEAELNRIETQLFEHRNFAEALAMLEEFEGRIRRALRSSQEKTDLLYEVFYHEALCHRKLGHTRRAEVILTALWRSHSDNEFGTLARSWLDLH